MRGSAPEMEGRGVELSGVSMGQVLERVTGLPAGRAEHAGRDIFIALAHSDNAAERTEWPALQRLGLFSQRPHSLPWRNGAGGAAFSVSMANPPPNGGP